MKEWKVLQEGRERCEKRRNCSKPKFLLYLQPRKNTSLLGKALITLLKTGCENERSLVISIFFFSLNVFNSINDRSHILRCWYIYFYHRSANAFNLPESKFSMFGIEFNLYLTISTFNDPGKKVTIIFSFSHNVFYPSQKEFLFWSYIYFVVCKCFQFGPA